MWKCVEDTGEEESLPSPLHMHAYLFSHAYPMAAVHGAGARHLRQSPCPTVALLCVVCVKEVGMPISSSLVER